MKNRRLATRLIQERNGRLPDGAPVTLPIYQSSTYTYPDLFRGAVNYDDFKYLRLNNSPNHEALAKKIASMENTEDALVTSSGMAAISASLFSVLKAGDHLLAQDCLYGGTLSFINEDLKDLGIQVDYFHIEDVDRIGSFVKSNTKAIYIESVTNPLLQIIDVEKVAKFARSKALVSLIDNTFPSPVNFSPADWGVDIVLHSGTKYLNGHSDLCVGAVASSRSWIERIKHKLNHLGGCLDPNSCFLLQRSLKTLDLRVKAHNANAGAVAQFLERHPKVERVYYPGLESHPQHKLAKEKLRGFGGMLSLTLKGGARAAQTFCESTQIFQHAPSLGGVESLLTIPWLTTHVGQSEEERRRIGLSPALLRLSVGLEDREDLIEDLASALEKIN